MVTFLERRENHVAPNRADRSDVGPHWAAALDSELATLRAELTTLRAENARLLRLLELTPDEARPAGPSQTAIFEAAPGVVHAESSPAAKVAFYASLFAARTDVYAVRWDNARSGKSGWMPAVKGGWRSGVPPAQRQYLPLTNQVLTEHLSGDVEIGLYPMLDGDRCGWLAADFDGPAAILDALSYLKAARAARAPAALEVSRSGSGAHAWLFFTSPVPAATARQIGTGLLREAMALRGRLSLSSYDRLFPSQDVLQTGGLGNLIAAPLAGKARRRGTTVFLDLATLEPHEDQWAYLSSLDRLTPRDADRLVQRLGQVSVGANVDRLQPATSTKITVQAPAIVHAQLGASIAVEGADLPPALLATLKHRPRCQTRSSTSGNAAGPRPGTYPASCRASMRPSPVTSSCHAVFAIASSGSSNKPVAGWRSLTNATLVRDTSSRSQPLSRRSSKPQSTRSSATTSGCSSRRRERARL